MIQTTRWSPDTCKCVVEYSWDDSLSQSARVHTVSNVISRCFFHALLTDINTHYTALIDENPRKNKVIGQLTVAFPTLTETDTKGNIRLKDGVVTWFYDTNRILQVSIPLLTQPQKNTAQSWCDTNLGAGKVVIT